MKNRVLRFIILRKYRIALILLDIAFINLAIYLSCFLLKRPLASASFHLTATILWLITASMFLLYSVFRYSVKPIISAVATEWIVLNLATFYISALIAARAALLFMLPIMIIFILGHRLLLRSIRSLRFDEKAKDETRVLILGLGEKAREIAKEVESRGSRNYKVVGFLGSKQQDERNIKVDTQDILGEIENLYEIVNKKRASEVIIAFPAYTPLLHKRIERIMRDHSELGIRFKVIPDLYDALIGRLKINRITGYPLLDILAELPNRRYLIYKRLMDVCISFVGLVLLSPILLLIAVILKFYERGPVLYRQERVGESGMPFILYKFRSMVPNAEEDTGPIWAREDDERVTAFGRFLRRNSLDELPQLWNVLKGDMSLVGPRPERPHFVNNHKELQGRRLNIKPGITGMAQINGRYNLTARQKAKYDYIYLKSFSFGLDVTILIKTVDAVLSKRGAW